MSEPYVIAISRQYGSGGHEIGKKLAQALDIKFYDKRLLAEIAKKSGMSQNMVEYYDEMPTRSLLFSLAMDAYPMSFAEVPLNQKVYQTQVDAIKDVAQREPCVIVGRCADVILADYPNVVSVFIHGDMESRIRRVMQCDNLTHDKAREKILKTDKKRASFYNFYSMDKRWGESGGSDLIVNSSRLGIDETVGLIYSYVKLKGFLS